MTDLYEFTVEDYANYIINNPTEFSADDVSIAKTMLTYGKYTQDYFGYNTENKPTNINTLNSTDLSKEAYELTDTNSSISFIGARLVLTSTPGLKLYFNKDVDITCADGEISTEGNYKVVTITNVSNIYNKYEVTGENFKLKYSIASYGNIALNGTNDSLKNLIKAMVAYYDLFK